MNVARSHRLRLFIQLAIVVAASLYPLCAQTAAGPVTVYYFHSTTRCADCLEIERLAGEILQESFSQELASGQLIWHPVNVNLPENTHFIFVYDLAANELVVVRDHQGGKDDWNKLPEAWKDIQEPEKFRSKLVGLVRHALSPAEEGLGRSS